MINRFSNDFRTSVGRLTRNMPSLRQSLLNAEHAVESQLTSLSSAFPQIVRPRPRRLFISLTGRCNWRCHGCRYERDFMVGEQLPLAVIRDALDDARAAGMQRVRLYGGEPLMHPHLAEVIAHCTQIGIKPFVTTNAVLLPQKIDKLYEAGLRDISVGFYGLGADLDAYVQRRGHAEKFEKGIAAVRERYGSNVSIQLNWLLRRDTCSVETLDAAFEFAKKYETLFQVDMIHYSLPYFTKGMDQELYFRPEDRSKIERVIDRLLTLKAQHPHMVHSPEPALRSISDWLLLGPEMKVPCTAGEIIWIGPDGSVQLCYVTFKLGNLHQKRLKEMLFSKDHADAARGAFKLDCPNCHCEAGDRVMRHAPSRRLYEIPIRVTDSR